MSYHRLLEEANISPELMKVGDTIIFIAMGPGATIETALATVSA